MAHKKHKTRKAAKPSDPRTDGVLHIPGTTTVLVRVPPETSREELEATATRIADELGGATRVSVVAASELTVAGTEWAVSHPAGHTGQPYPILMQADAERAAMDAHCKLCGVRPHGILRREVLAWHDGLGPVIGELREALTRGLAPREQVTPTGRVTLPGGMAPTPAQLHALQDALFAETGQRVTLVPDEARRPAQARVDDAPETPGD